MRWLVLLWTFLILLVSCGTVTSPEDAAHPTETSVSDSTDTSPPPQDASSSQDTPSVTHDVPTHHDVHVNDDVPDLAPDLPLDTTVPTADTFQASDSANAPEDSNDDVPDLAPDLPMDTTVPTADTFQASDSAIAPEDSTENQTDAGCTDPPCDEAYEFSCQNEGWNCDSCSPGESCVLGRCAPTALIFNDSSMGFYTCPLGYQRVGSWKNSEWNTTDALDGYPDSLDHTGFTMDGGRSYLCSADPDNVFMSLTENDCGGEAVDICDDADGVIKGSFHVGSSCQNNSHARDRDNNVMVAGWISLCVLGDQAVKIETHMDDCGEVSPTSCGDWSSRGRWHAYPQSCDGGITGVGTSGQSIKSGWMELCVASGKHPPADPQTLEKKVLAGYQGWFRAPGDGAGAGWFHWFSETNATANTATFDLWPDMSELDPDERFDTQMSLSNNAPAQVFSSYNKKTVKRHFRWMAEHGIDGVFLQRFLVDLLNPSVYAFRNKVTQNVCAGATTYGRSFAIMYDISGAPEESFVQQIKDDWAFMVDEMLVTNSPGYLHEDGLPVLAIWGLGFEGRPGTVAQATEIINYFQNEAPAPYRAYVVGGVPFHWRNSNVDSKPGFQNVYKSYDTVSPWSVGRFDSTSSFDSNFNNVIQGDQTYANANSLSYAPVIWPGFSWTNLNGGSLNQIPRAGGSFMWHQVAKIEPLDPQFIYVAMFDEVDEATAIFKAATSQSQLPTTGQFLHLGQDGLALPSDWYLRLTGAAKKALVGQFVPELSLPISP